jgi:hypothetical protein
MPGPIGPIGPIGASAEINLGVSPPGLTGLLTRLAEQAHRLNLNVALRTDDVVWLPGLNRWVGATSPRLPKRLRWGDDAILCVICEVPIIAGLGAIAIWTARKPEQWLHEGDCYAEFAAWHQDTSVMDCERALELLERARRAGRLKSSNPEME